MKPFSLFDVATLSAASLTIVLIAYPHWTSGIQNSRSVNAATSGISGKTEAVLEHTSGNTIEMESEANKLLNNHADEAMTKLISEWASNDVGAALRWANEISEHRMRNAIISQIISLSRNPIMLSSAIENQHIDIAKIAASSNNEFLTTFVLMLGREMGPSEAAAWISRNMTGRWRSAAYANVIADLAFSDISASKSLLDSLPAGSARAFGERSFVRALSIHSPEMAMNFLAENNNQLLIDAELGEIVSKWITSDRHSLLGFINSLSNTDFKSAIRDSSIQQLSVSDPKAALDMRRELKDSRPETFVSIYKNWSLRDPYAAYVYLREDSGADFQAVTPVIVSSALTKGKHEEAAKIVEALDESDLKIRSVKQVMEKWTTQDLNESAVWVQRLRPSKAYDAGVVVLVTQLAKSQPSDAVRWAETLPEGPIRAGLMKSIKVDSIP